MPMIHYAAREIHVKLVYYGPGLCGKTTNVRWISQKAPQNARGKLISLNTETERTLFFDFMPLSLGKIRGFQVRVHLYTVPGQVFYNASRQLIMKGADGVIFVADSQEERWEANLESFDNLQDNLALQNLNLQEVSYVLQCNKRDLTTAMPIDAMNAKLNPYQDPCIPAVAFQGKGVLQTLKTSARSTLRRIKARL